VFKTSEFDNSMILQEPGGMEVVIYLTWMVSGIQEVHLMQTMHLMVWVLHGKIGEDMNIH